MKLTSAQENDLRSRLESFKKFGLLPAEEAASKFRKVITSSERLLNKSLCFNLVNLTEPSQSQSTSNILMCHSSHGFINMAIERHYYTECSDMEEAKQMIAERLFCSFIFIFNPSSILQHPTAVRRENPLRHDVTKQLSETKEVMANTSISPSLFYAVLVPEGLELIVQEFFPGLRVYGAPLKNSELILSSFTIGTAISLPNRERSLSDIEIPDYELALQNFMDEHPQIKSFATHITRFATTHCLLNPFRMYSADELKKIQLDSMLRIFQAECESKQMCSYQFKTPTARHSFFALDPLTDFISQIKITRGAGFAPFLKSIKNREYNQAIRRLCTSTSEAPVILEILQQIQELQLPINVSEQVGEQKTTALHYAAKRADREVYNYLCQLPSADLTLKDSSGRTASEYLPEHSTSLVMY